MDNGGGNEGGTCEEDLSSSGSACDSGDSCWDYPYLVCIGSVANAATCKDSIISDYATQDGTRPDGCTCLDVGGVCKDGSFCCTPEGGELSPKQPDVRSLLGSIMGRDCAPSVHLSS